MARKKDPLIGGKIVANRRGTEVEKRTMMWDSDFMVIELDTGALLFATRDPEMNDAGVLNYTYQGKMYSLL